MQYSIKIVEVALTTLMESTLHRIVFSHRLDFGICKFSLQVFAPNNNLNLKKTRKCHEGRQVDVKYNVALSLVTKQ